MLIVVYTKEMVRTFQFVVLIMKCTNVPLISRADGYTRFPAKQCKIYKIYFFVILLIKYILLVLISDLYEIVTCVYLTRKKTYGKHLIHDFKTLCLTGVFNN